jgi:O-succinylbenzoic acid--CoA ligase
VVGGGNLAENIYQSARELGWPLLPSYGMTEVGSQVATAPLSSLTASGEFPPLEVLSHIRLHLGEGGRIRIGSEALCELVALIGMDASFSLEDPRRSGFLLTDDLGEWRVCGRSVKILGRRDSLVKVLGVLVSLLEVEQEATSFFHSQGWREAFTVIAVPEARLGTKLLLVTDSPLSLKKWEYWVRRYNCIVQGPRRLQSIGWVPKLPRTDLKKVKVSELTHIFGA